MKKVFISALVLLSLSGMAQKSALSDPALGRITVSSLNGEALNPDQLPLDKMIRIKLPVTNAVGGKFLPAGSCKIKLGFGSKLELDPYFSLLSAEMHEYFTWTAVRVGEQLQVVGELVNPLPAGMVDVGLVLKVKGTMLGTSTITANFLVSNHRSDITLSDNDPTNNSTYLAYTITGKTGPSIKITEAARFSCRINLAFSAEKEINLSRYDVEVSKDGFNYVKVSEVAATAAGNYLTGFQLTDDIKATNLFVRIKSVDKDGNYLFSSAKAISGNCDKAPSAWVLSVYPNPATDIKVVTISATQGMFNGKYKITMLDMSGRLVQVKEQQLDNVQKFNYNLGTLGAGKYLIQVQNGDGSEAGVMQLEKL